MWVVCVFFVLLVICREWCGRVGYLAARVFFFFFLSVGGKFKFGLKCWGGFRHVDVGN